MKKLISIMIALLLCLGIAGCGNRSSALKYCVPHNPEIKLSDSMENIIEKDELILAEESENDSNEYLEGDKYCTKNSVTVNGIEFNPASYRFNEYGKIKILFYYSSDNADSFDQLKEYLSDIYGNPEESSDTLSWYITVDSTLEYQIRLDVNDYGGLSFGIMLK